MSRLKKKLTKQKTLKANLFSSVITFVKLDNCLPGQLRRPLHEPPASSPDPPPQSCPPTDNAGTTCGGRGSNNSRAEEPNRGEAARRTDRPGR